MTVWDLARRQPCLRIPGARHFDFHPRGGPAAAALRDGSIRLYDLSTGNQDGALKPELKGYSLFLCFNAQGTKLAVASDGKLFLLVWADDRALVGAKGKRLTYETTRRQIVLDTPPF